MVMIALIAITILVGLWAGLRTDPFDIMHAIGYWFIGILSTVVILGMLSWHSFEVEREFKVYDVISLDQGIAVNTYEGGKYIRYSVTRMTDRCDEPTLTETKFKTYPYQTIKPFTTATFYVLCLPDQP